MQFDHQTQFLNIGMVSNPFLGFGMSGLLYALRESPIFDPCIWRCQQGSPPEKIRCLGRFTVYRFWGHGLTKPVLQRDNSCQGWPGQSAMPGHAMQRAAAGQGRPWPAKGGHGCPWPAEANRNHGLGLGLGHNQIKNRWQFGNLASQGHGAATTGGNAAAAQVLRSKHSGVASASTEVTGVTRSRGA